MTTTTRVSALDYPALDGRGVTQAHARYCADHGHATHTVDGTPTGTCPRCGEVDTRDADAYQDMADDYRAAGLPVPPYTP